MIVSENATSNYQPCPPGSYLARVCRIVDAGTQTADYNGEIKTARKAIMGFEVLSDEVRRDDGQPYVLSKRYTLSLHEKSALRKDLAGARGRDFTPEELRAFDMHNVLGATVFVSVITTTKGDRTYSNIAALMRPPKGLAVHAGTEPLLFWDMSSATPDWSAFAQLHRKLQEQIEASPEYQRLTPPKTISLGANQPAAPASQAQAATKPVAPAPAQAMPEPPAYVTEPVPDFADMADDIPF